MKDLIINENPKSMFSESIKTIRTNLAFSSVDKEIKVILTTSPESGDGKSFISANLAAAYAQEGKKVLIIDCDLRKGRQHEIFNIKNSSLNGYSNLILNYEDETDLSEYIVRTKSKNIDLIPTGPMPPNPVELLNSDNNRDLIACLREFYDIIILDCPPVVGLSDTLVLTKYSDANILVVSVKKTKMESVERAIKQFDQIGVKLTGVVLNKSLLKDNGYYFTNDAYYSDDNKKSKTKKRKK